MRPPATVFATIADIGSWPQFVRGIERLEWLTEGAIGVGTRFRETRMMFGRSASEEMTIARFEPPYRMVLTAENHGVNYVATHELVPAGESTRLVLTFEGTPVSVAAKLFSIIGGLFVAPLRRQLQADLDDLKVEAERRARL